MADWAVAGRLLVGPMSPMHDSGRQRLPRLLQSLLERGIQDDRRIGRQGVRHEGADAFACDSGCLVAADFTALHGCSLMWGLFSGRA